MIVRCRPGQIVKALCPPLRYFRQSPLRRLSRQPTKLQCQDFAFAFDIDGVLMRSSKPIPRARESILHLQEHQIPFILLTNGGGKHESERVAELSKSLDVELDTRLFIQSHTPFQDLVTGTPETESLKDNYGFTNVITPGDIITAHPEIWPFSQNFASYYASHARPLKHPIANVDTNDLSKALKVDAIFIFNDPRDWALDTQLILDLLLSHKGYLGTVSERNGNEHAHNFGYQQDEQPGLYFSNPDLHWAAAYHVPRLGQGGFREAFEGVWRAVTCGKEGSCPELEKTMYGKPNAVTYAYAEKKLELYRGKMLGEVGAKQKLKKVYMVGDNPQSDIRGANEFRSPRGIKWRSILVQTGVYTDGAREWEPDTIVGDVWDAVQWAIADVNRTPPKYA